MEQSVENHAIDIFNYVIKTPIKSYRISEIEFYIYNDEHKDEYVHRSSEQQTMNKFYFHKYNNGSFKSGTWKGVDLCFGEENKYYGVLIRSIVELDTGKNIEGPCKSVNEILSNYGCTVVSELSNKYPQIFQLDFFDPQNPLHIVKSDDSTTNDLTIYKGFRFGLSDKYPLFKNMFYRYSTVPLPKKGKNSSCWTKIN
jgi:hypothetical protein